MKPDSFWHRRRTIREGIVVAIVVALSTGVFFGVARVMSALGSSQTTALTPPAAERDDGYADDDQDDAAASENNSDTADSPQSE